MYICKGKHTIIYGKINIQHMNFSYTNIKYQSRRIFSLFKMALLHFKKKNIYFTSGIILLWITLNVVILNIASNDNSVDQFLYFYPFNYNTCPGLWAYDISEFLVYGIILTLSVLFLISFILIHLQGKVRKICLRFCIAFVIYCFGFVFISIFYNPSLVGLYIAIFKGVIIFFIAFYFAGYIIEKIKS